jgi:SAM-dependent methyltransferase
MDEVPVMRSREVGGSCGAPVQTAPGSAAGPRRKAVDYDAELQRLDRVFGQSYGPRAADRVLDIGCGAGQTTRDAARRAHSGSATGVDRAADMVDRARASARAEGLSNVTFLRADAQVHPFEEGAFDLVISRFGTMFFDDPTAAFSNIRRAIRRGGRLVMMVWQAEERNEWAVAIARSLGTPPEGSAPTADGHDPFSLADPAAVEELLGAAGFSDVAFTDVHEPVYYGPDVEAALDWVRGFASTRDALERLDAASAAQALERLRVALAEHHFREGVWFDARAWIVTATRP